MCKRGMQPIVLSGVFRDVLTAHFADNHVGAMVDPVLRNPEYLASDDMNFAGISIETIGTRNVKVTGQRPSIRIRYNGQKTVNIGIGNGYRMDPEGNRMYTLQKAGSHTFFCIGGTELEAVYLATEVEVYFDIFSPELRAELNLLQLTTVDQAQPGQLEESSESWISPVTVAWSYNVGWTLKPVALKMNSIGMSTTANGTPVL